LAMTAEALLDVEPRIRDAKAVGTALVGTQYQTELVASPLGEVLLP